MNLLKRLDDNTEIEWWNKNRKIANVVIDQYNNWQLGECDTQSLYTVFALGYSQLDRYKVDYAEHFDIIRDALFESGVFDMSFYKGF